MCKLCLNSKYRYKNVSVLQEKTQKQSVYVCFCRAAPLISTIPTASLEASETWRENGQMEMLVGLFTHALVQ